MGIIRRDNEKIILDDIVTNSGIRTRNINKPIIEITNMRKAELTKAVISRS